MNEKIEAVKAWIMSNKLIAGIAGFILLLFVYKKFARKTYRRRRRTLPRSVNYPVRRKRAGSTARRRPGAKKAWQVKGSLAAKRRMAQIRRKRNSKLF